MMGNGVADLPYRPCVGVMLINRRGLVWIGHRIQVENDAEGEGKWWQMPQGGIDRGEDPVAAAFRELEEETSVRSASHLSTSSEWFRYDLPEHLIGVAWKGRYRGQQQLWIALRFDGDDSEIDVSVPGHKPEFDDWRWVDIDSLVELIVPFKRKVYERVVAEFRHLTLMGRDRTGADR